MGAVDFGLVSCGGDAPAPKILKITNAGAGPLTWSAHLTTGADFSITGPSSGTIAPGASGTLTLASSAVPALSGAGDTAQDVITVTTNDVQNASSVLPVQRTAAGGQLTVVPLTAAFGETPTGIPAQDIPVSFTNTGNQPVSISFGAPAPAGGGFSVGYAGAPAFVSVAPGATVPALVAKFLPSVVASFSSTASIDVTGALCGTNPSELTLTGKGNASVASVQPGALDFGLVDCGTTAAAKTIKIINSGPSPFTWNAALAKGAASAYQLGAPSGTVAANSSVQVTVTPKMVPATSAVSPNLYGDTLTITTNVVNDDPHVVDLRETAHGAVLAQSTGSIAFGSVTVSTPATSAFTVSNNGNAAATVSYTAAPSVFTVSPQSQVVGAGASYAATAGFLPTAQQAYSGTASMSVAAGTPLCAPLPAAIALSGNGAVSASVTPTSVDFGLVACGNTGSQKNVTLTNTSSAAFSWSAAVGTSYYTLSPSSGSLATGASVSIAISPKAIPSTSSTMAVLYADALTITTTPALESPYVASLHMTAQGAILSFNPTSIDFGSQKKGTSRTTAFSIVNSGNVAAGVTLSKGGAEFSVSPTSQTVTAGSNAAANATFSPNGLGTRTGSTSMSTTAKRCAPLPAALTFTGVGL
jgi:hypothetical protein